MRSIPLLSSLLVALAACGGAKMDKASPQYAQVHAMGAAELRCPEKKVKVQDVGDSRVVVSGCDKSTPYVYACRRPGPKELEYLGNTPEPPTDEAIAELEGSTTPEDQQRVMDMRQQQIQYSQAIVAIRLEDLQSGQLEEIVPRHRLPRVPKGWVQSECRYMHEE